MRIRKEHLHRAAEQGVLEPGAADALWQNLGQQLADEPALKLRYVLYYFGAMLLLLPVTIFIGPAWAQLGDAGLLAAAAAFVAAMLWGALALERRHWRVSAGILGATAVGASPLVWFLLLKTLGVEVSTDAEHFRDFHRYIRSEWVVMEVLTLLFASFALYRLREPFMLMPVAVTLWYMSMDIGPLLFPLGGADASAGKARASAVFGLLVLLFSYAIEKRTRHTTRDYTFWLWLAGTLAFWGGLTGSDAGGETAKALYALTNLAMIFTGALVGRRVLTVFGAIGVTGYLGHLCLSVFKDSLAFPLAVMVLGGAFIVLAMKWPRWEAAIQSRLTGRREGRGSA